jgi:hypothetical protein
MMHSESERRFQALPTMATLCVLLSSAFYLTLALILISIAFFNTVKSVEISPIGGIVIGTILICMGLPGILGVVIQKRRRLFFVIAGGVNAIMIPLFPILLPLPLGFPVAAALLGLCGIILLNGSLSSR